MLSISKLRNHPSKTIHQTRHIDQDQCAWPQMQRTRALQSDDTSSKLEPQLPSTPARRSPEPDTPLSHYSTKLHRPGSLELSDSPDSQRAMSRHSLDSNRDFGGTEEKSERRGSAPSLSEHGLTRRRGDRTPSIDLTGLGGVTSGKGLGKSSESRNGRPGVI